MKSMQAVFAVAIAICASSSLVFSQCPVPDGFSGGSTAPCCAPAAPNLPTFPAMTLNGLGACIKDCAVESQFNTVATLAPSNLLCDYRIITLALSGPPGVAFGNQTVVAKYDRTWQELVVPGTPPWQVWRFLVNVDITYALSAASTPGCPIPLSAFPPFSLPVHFVGHIDYARSCTSGAWQVAYSLTHFCPTEMHAPFSQRPIASAAGWPKRTYHFVGPANFTFGICPPPSGPIIAESTRTSVGLSNPVPYTCLREAQVFQGNLQNQAQNCVCFDPVGIVPPARYTHQNLGTTEICAGAGAPIIAFGGFGVPFLPTGLRALSVGSWAATAAQPYPGNRCLSVYLGIFESVGACPAPGAGPFHAVTGVGTTGGNPVGLLDSMPTVFLPYGFLDLQQMLVLSSAGFVPGLGGIFGSERVWSFNTP